MDCICIGKQECLGAVANNKDSYFILSKDYELIEIDIATSHVKNRVQVPKEKLGDNLITLKYNQEHIYIFWGQSEYLVFRLNPPEFLLDVECGGKKPYIPHSTAFTDDLIIFSTFSHSNIYILPIFPLAQQGFSKKPSKLKMTSKVIANHVVVQPMSSFLIAACSDGLIRVWNYQTIEEFLPIIDSGTDQKANKKIISHLMKKNILHQINCLEFNHNGSRLLSGDDAGVINAWNTSDITNYLLDANIRISEQGILGVSWINDDNFIGLIKEGTLILMQISQQVSGSTKRNLPSKIKIVSQSLFSIPHDVISSFPRQELRCLYSLSNNTVLLVWPFDNMKYIFHLSLINSQNASNGYPAICPMIQQPIESLITSPIKFPAYFYFISKNDIIEYSVKDGKQNSIANLPPEQAAYLSLECKPKSGGNPIDILAIKEIKGTKYAHLLRKNGANITSKQYNGVAGCILGEENEIGENLLIVGEDRSSVILYYLDGDEEPENFTLSMKIKNVYWTPLQYGFSVVYETLHEHSIRLSKSVRTGRTEDVDLSDKDVFKLTYDEILTCLKWDNVNIKLAIGTSKRICILNSELQPLEQCILEKPKWSVPTSVFWYGNTLLFSRHEGIYYYSKRIKLLFQVLTPSIICGALNDRILLAVKSNNIEIQARPITMLEPLISGYIKTHPDEEKINKIVRMMNTPLISEDLIKNLLDSGYSEAAWFLVENSESSYVSLPLRIKILKKLNLFDDILDKLLHKKYLEDPYELKHFLVEFNSDHNWKLEKNLISEMAKYFEERGQLLKAAKCLELTNNLKDLEILLAQQGINPSPYILNSKQSVFIDPPGFQDIDFQIQPPNLFPIKLGFGESPFIQLANSFEIIPTHSDNIGQWFGWDSLKEFERAAPQFIDLALIEEEKGGNQELSEEEALAVYLRCDEGKGNQLGNVMNSKAYFINERMWGGMLDEGDPMEYEDKWGKRCQPNYSLSFVMESRLVIDDLKPDKKFSIEFWCSLKALEDACLFKTGTFECRIDNAVYKCTNNAYSLKLIEPKHEQDEEFQPILPIVENIWFHTCITYSTPNLSIYKNGRLMYTANVVDLSMGDSFIFGGLNGYISEIRIWKTQRKSEQIKEVYKCPHDILTEKRRKKWTAIKINKNESENKEKAAGLLLPKPEQPIKLQAPKSLKPPGRLLAPPKAPVKLEEKSKSFDEDS
ncbi:unnamed protein product [Blepharisma stoltei]|uniref:Uncharacterized protein n=1 Tax=Blepharisma stoltei TaxID=1481888 RepID=A0AAU9JFU0_9CILI|nr:unnamed protein product [Blepharisma stoltei]